MTMYKNFRSFAAFKVFAENTGDIDFLGKIAIVEKHKREIPSLIEKIKVRCRADPKTADYVFTTTHKSKGLEWKTVILLHDFNTPYSAEIYSVRDEFGFRQKLVKEVKFSEDEKNLLYVALTRAKEYLAINFDLRELLWVSGETFEKVIKNSPTNTSCLKCDKDPSSYSNVLSLATSHKLWNPTKDLKNPTNTGNLCTLCSSEAFIEAARRYPLASKRKGPRKDITSSNARKFLRYMVGTKADHYEEALTQNINTPLLARLNHGMPMYVDGDALSNDEDNPEDDDDDDDEDQVNNGAVANGFDGGLLNEDDGVDEIIGTMNTNEIRDNANAIPDDGMDEELGNISDNFLDDSLEEELLRV